MFLRMIYRAQQREDHYLNFNDHENQKPYKVARPSTQQIASSRVIILSLDRQTDNMHSQLDDSLSHNSYSIQKPKK